MVVGIIRQKPVFTHASIVCEGMVLASVNSVNKTRNANLSFRSVIRTYPDLVLVFGFGHEQLVSEIDLLYYRAIPYICRIHFVSCSHDTTFNLCDHSLPGLQTHNVSPATDNSNIRVLHERKYTNVHMDFFVSYLLLACYLLMMDFVSVIFSVVYICQEISICS